MRRWLRVARVGAHLVAGCALSALAYPLLPRRARLAVRRAWARGVLDILEVRLQADLAAFAPGSLLVANHVSWLDAVVLNALAPCAVVAKSQTRRWPLLGGILERNDTLFVERRPCRALLALNAEIGVRLARGEAVAVFPEGTTTEGSRLLAFRPALFEPAVRGGHPVRALALAYLDADGGRCTEAAFIDEMTLWESLCRIAALPELTAGLRDCGGFHGAGLRRREAARRAQAAVEAGLVPVALEPDVEPHLVADRRHGVLHAEVGTL